MKFSHRNTLTKATQKPGWEDTSVNLHFLSKFAKTRNLFHKSSFFSYSGYTTGSTGWYLWSKKTSVQPARSVTTVTPTSPEPECPVVWRQWQPDDSNVGRIDKRR